MGSENINDEIDEILKEVKAKAAGTAEAEAPGGSACVPAQPEAPAEQIFEKESAGEPAQNTAGTAVDAPPEVGQANRTAPPGNMKKEGKTLNKKVLAVIIAAVVIIAAGVGIFFSLHNKGNSEEDTTVSTTQSTTAKQAETPVANPLTGDEDFSESAMSTRILSVVVENSADARPQYNMDSADVIMEVEVEGGITRMLWLYADMSSLPEQVGPVRSARPVLVELSELFDSIFVHYGGSHSTDNYVGGYEIISSDGVDDVDGMSVSSCFRRTSDKVSPHNAVLLGDNIVSTIKDKGYSTEKSSSAMTQFSFYDKLTAVSDTACSSVSVKISSVTNTHTLTYSADSALYTNASDYGKSVSFSNVLVLYANTSYVTTGTYTYCLYTLTSGSGKLISGGSVADIKWSIDNDVLTLTDTAGGEVKLNKGKSWIAVASANNGGSVTVA